MPPKKKASGDASKGEKIFKNLCGVCHSLSVSLLTTNLLINRLTQSVPVSVLLLGTTLLRLTASLTPRLSPPKLP